MKNLFSSLFFIMLLIVCSNAMCLQQHDDNKINIPVGGNAWTNTTDSISDQGLIKWVDPNTRCKSYVRLSQPGTLKVSLAINAQGKQSSVKVIIGGKSKTIQIQGDGEQEYFAGEWIIKKSGYTKIEILGVKKSGDGFGKLSTIFVSGSAVTADAAYVKDNNDNYFYWGRRGPSVHLNYSSEGVNNIEWFYNEITVPKGNDVIGSYFMANGFKEGYFGIQVNSESERRVLFSVWSPFQTDDPGSIPEEEKIKMIKKGKTTYTGEFGNEGAGGQSYVKFNWKAGNTYRFLLRGRPVENNYTEYTAYFFAPEENKWMLIASFLRPKTSTYLTRLHSFLENFIPETGNISRMVTYSNQWVVDSSGKWTELSKATFTGDNTARKNFRKDYAGGIYEGVFYLRNCGFFNEFVNLNQPFSRSVVNKNPAIDLQKLVSDLDSSK